MPLTHRKPDALVSSWGGTEVPSTIMDGNGANLLRYAQPRAKLLKGTRGWNEGVAGEFRNACLQRGREHVVAALKAASFEDSATQLGSDGEVPALFEAAERAWLEASARGEIAANGVRDAELQSNMRQAAYEQAISTGTADSLPPSEVLAVNDLFMKVMNANLELALAQNRASLMGSAALSLKSLIVASGLVYATTHPASAPEHLKALASGHLSTTDVAATVAACACYSRLQSGGAIYFAERVTNERIDKVALPRLDREEVAWQADWLSHHLSM